MGVMIDPIPFKCPFIEGLVDRRIFILLEIYFFNPQFVKNVEFVNFGCV